MDNLRSIENTGTSCVPSLATEELWKYIVQCSSQKYFTERERWIICVQLRTLVYVVLSLVCS